MRNKARELLPCPFCGFQPQIDDDDCIYPATRDRKVWQIVCYETGGGCSAHILGSSPEDCIAKWNRRRSYLSTPTREPPTVPREPTWHVCNVHAWLGTGPCPKCAAPAAPAEAPREIEWQHFGDAAKRIRKLQVREPEAAPAEAPRQADELLRRVQAYWRTEPISQDALADDIDAYLRERAAAPAEAPQSDDDPPIGLAPTLHNTATNFSEDKPALADLLTEAAARIESDAARIRELEAKNGALRELMNCYNVGGWTDAERLQKERDEARAELAAANERIRELETALRELLMALDGDATSGWVDHLSDAQEAAEHALAKQP